MPSIRQRDRGPAAASAIGDLVSSRPTDRRSSRRDHIRSLVPTGYSRSCT